MVKVSGCAAGNPDASQPGVCCSDFGPVLTAPVSAGPDLFVAVRAHPGPFRPAKTASIGPEQR